MTFIALAVSSLSTAINVAMYAVTHSPWSLGAAIFCGIFTVFNLIKAREDT